MELTGLSLATVVLFLPMVGMTILLFLREDQVRNIKLVALGTTIVTFLFSLVLWAQFDPNNTSLQMVQKVPWIPSLNISYYVGVDGLNLLMILLTTFIMPIAILISWRAHVLEERGRQKLYFVFMLLLEWAMLGVFLAQDLILFYIFWEVTLVPMYFMIGIWGSEQRVYAAVKFFLYTMAGSLLMLVAILYLGLTAGTFSQPDIVAMMKSGELSLPMAGVLSVQSLLFLAFFIAFAIKVPVWPFHSWLPDAHVQAPTAASVILAGVLLKLGSYSMIRYNIQLFPDASVQWAPFVAVLAVIGIIYGAWVSYAQTDMKKLVAYSSVSHMGFIVLGIFAMAAASMQGSVLQMVNHGISTGGLFLIVGMLYERRHTRQMSAYGGLWAVAPVLGAFALIISLSSMGMPGTNGFVGEFTILLGSVGSQLTGVVYTIVAAMGVILAAIYMLAFFQKVFMGEVKHEENRTLPRLHWTELAVLVPIVIMILWIGLAPNTFLAPMDPSVNALVQEVQPPATEIAQLP
jgi:NADH-quinone oxidoreductase subunit M